MAKKIQMMSHDKEWQMVDGVETLVPVEQFDIDPVTDSSCVKIEGFRTLEETLNEKNMFTPEVNATKVMDKVGGEYHQNVVDGAYEEAILYGNTQVNLCEEDSSNALQIPTTFTSFNNGELKITNKENQVVAPLIKGVTMVNLAQINSSSVASGKGVPIQNVKGNTVYTLSFTFTTKNTNSGVVIECYDVNGEYLGNVMHKTGLGDVVKFTFTTHANTTKVHICNNAAYGGETIQLDEIMLIEGDQTVLDVPFFKGMKSVELVRPLTNLFTNDTSINTHNATVTNSNGTVTVTSTYSSAWSAGSILLNTSLKPNTKYLVMWDNLEYTQTSTVYLNEIIGVYITNGNTKISYINNDLLCPTKRSLIFDTKSYQLDRICLRIHATLSNTETGTTTVKGLRVFEYDDYLRSVDLQSIGWFSGTKNVAVEPIKTCSKNLYPYGDVSFTPTSAGWFDAKGNGNMYGDIAQKSKSRFLLKKGTYYLSMGEGTNISSVQLINDKEEMLPYTPLVLEQDTYLTIRVNASQANVATTLTNIQIERGETATDYVAHDSRYYEPDGQNAIVLRSLPNGVCDTFNLQTGEYTRRIGEAVFDGSEEWTQNGNGNYGFFTTKQDSKPSSTIVCDKLKEITGWNNYSEKGIFRGTQAFGIVVTSNELTTCNVETFKTWLSQNPLTVQYELATPTTTIIPRAIKRNNNGAVSTIDFGTYTNKESLVLPKNPSYLTINSMTSIKPVVEPITYIDFKTRLKTNTDYSVIMDKDSANKTIKLGETSKTYANKMLVRTPSINLEQNLRISGSGSIQNIMVIEGDVLDKELPYFNGMCNVKMPIVRNMGRNLLDNNNVRVTYDTNIILRAYPTFPCKPGKRYVFCVDKLGTESACNWYSCKRDAVLVNSSKATGIIEYLGYSTSVVAPPDCKYLSIYTGGSTNLDPYSIHTYVYEVDTLAEAQAIGYTDYKENQICLVQGEIGLSQDMFEQGGFSGSSGNTYDNCKANTNTNIRMRTKGLITVKPNTTYIVNNNTSPNMNHVFYLFDESQKYLGSNIAVNAKSFVTPNNCGYVSLMFSKNSNANISVSEFKQELFQLLELDSTVQLRSLPNGVKDELNLLTGEYIQRVGEVVLDGSEHWTINATYKYFYNSIRSDHKSRSKGGMAISDKIIYLSSEQIVTNSIRGFSLGGSEFIQLCEPNCATVDELKTYLQSNPITVQYELAEPIISYPRIVSNTQEREVGVKLPNGICDTYNPSTGITVKRVGKAILDGSEDWVVDTTKTNTQVFKVPAPKDFAPTYNNFITESLPTNDGTGSDTEKIAANQSNHSATSGLIWCLYIAILKTKASTVSELKTYLASNPITVWYELKNPIVTTDIVLPNGVHDEYNPLTGLYAKRVGYVELDGSEEWVWGAPATGTDVNTKLFLSPCPQAQIISEKENCNIICDKLPYLYELWDTDQEGVHIFSNTTHIAIRVTKSKLSEETLVGLKTYLSQNPIKVWYELATPITYQLTPYFGLPMPYAYKDGYLIMDSAYDGQTLPPEIKYKLLANRTGQITQNNIKLQNHTSKLSNLEAMLVEATLQSMYEREMMAFNLEMVNINLINLEE